MIFIDFETRSKCIIQDTGAARYAEDPSTDVMCMAYARGDNPVELWMPGEECPFGPADIVNGEFEAHHSFFERMIWRKIMVPRYGWPDIPDSKWRCSAATACYHALPRALDQLCRALSLKHQKDLGGKRVMMKLSRPRAKYAGEDPAEMWSNSREDYKALYEYCRDDVEAERGVHTRLRALPPQEQAVWALDQRINERGIRVDMDAVRAALRILAEYEERLIAEFRKITGLNSPRQVAELVKWLAGKGVKVASLDKNAVISALGALGEAHPARRALEIRQALAKSSTAKYQAIVDSVCRDGRLRGLLMYHGASTGRWTGQLVQPQNLPVNRFKGNLDAYFDFLKSADLAAFEMVYPVAQTLSDTIRGVFIPAEGHVFVGGDYNAIEARVLFWLASESHGLNMFRNNEDIYRDMAATIFQVPVARVTKEQRDLGKRGILGCGYGMGPKKFVQTCWTQARLQISEDLAERAVQAYRTKYRTVAVLWQLQEMAAKQAIETNKPIRCGKVLWAVHDGFLFCRLPSGRCLAYYAPKIELVKKIIKSERPGVADEVWETMSITFMGLNSQTKQWERTSTYGGKIVENITQAVARDIMANAMLRCENRGFKVVLTVHDELLTEFWPNSDAKFPFIHEFGTIMADTPEWAAGLPVKAEAWTGRRYSK